MKQHNWPYLAAMIDGEGCVCISKYKKNKNGHPGYIVTVSITNTKEKLMKWLIEHFGGRYFTQWRNSNEGAHNKRLIYTWRVSGQKNRETVLLGTIPYLVLKREQALIALKFSRMHGTQNPTLREELMLACKALNHSESPETNIVERSEKEYSDQKIESGLMGDHESAPAVTLGTEHTSLAQKFEQESPQMESRFMREYPF